MTVAAATSAQPPAARARRIAKQALGYSFLLVPLWMFFEWGRPSQTLRLPLLISLTLLATWLSEPKKHWPVQATGALCFLGVLWLGVPMASNSYNAFWVAYAITVTIVTIVIPMMHVLRNPRQLRFMVNAMLAIFLYLGGWAVTHSGFGPAGAWGGQDENYVAAFMCVAIPFAYFSLFMSKSMMQRLCLCALLAIFVGAIVIGLSRGGFLGLCFVGLICLWNSPQKVLGFSIVGLAGLIAAVFAGEAYWAEMNTISDTDSGTANLRIELWKIAFQQFLHNPILGVGPGNFPWRAGEFQSSEQFAMFGRDLTGNAVTHSLYFELLSETGLLGTLAFCAVGYRTYSDLHWVNKRVGPRRKALAERQNKRGWKSADERELDALSCCFYYSLATAAAIVGYMVCSLFLSTLYYSTFWILCAISFALKQLALQTMKNSRTRAASQKRAAASEPDGAQRPGRPRPPVSQPARPQATPKPRDPQPEPAAVDSPRLSDLLKSRSR